MSIKEEKILADAGRLKNKCELCGQELDRIKLNIHHKDKNTENNVLDNLEILCLPCHRIRDGITGNSRPQEEVSGMIEFKNDRLIIAGRKLTPLDVQYLKILLRDGPQNCFDLAMKTGSGFQQYAQTRMRFMCAFGITLKLDTRGLYDINPEIKEALRKVLE